MLVAVDFQKQVCTIQINKLIEVEYSSNSEVFVVTTQVIQLELPMTLLERAHVRAVDETRELVTYLLENYVQELERDQRRQAYEAFYETRSAEDEAEELELLIEFAFIDAESASQITS